MATVLKKLATLISTSTLLLGLLVAIPLSFVFPGSAQAAACSVGDTSGAYTVSPSHGKVFYLDTGVTPRLDAAYVGYNIQSSSAKSNLWVKLTNFRGGQVSLANVNDEQQQIATLASGAANAKTAFFLLKASGTATATDQIHTVNLYEGNPNRGGALVYSCDFTFTEIQETIKASANKVQTITVPSNNPSLGSLIQVVVTGTTGQPGSGKTPDNDIIWLTPAGFSTWPTSALRLETTSVILDQDANFSTTTDQETYNNQLLISGIKTLTPGSGTAKLNSGSQYRATYSFRVIGPSASTFKVAPVAQISSGNQYKHSDTNSTAAGAFPTIDLRSVASTMTVTKKISPISKVTNKSLTSNVATLTTSEAHGLSLNDQIFVTNLGSPFDGTFTITSVPTTTTFTYAATNADITSAAVSTGSFVFKKDATSGSAIVPYEVKVASTSTTSVDEIVDTPDSGMTFITGSSTFKDVDRTSWTATADPVVDSTETGLSPRPKHFTGPFNASATTNVVLRYKMLIPTTSTATYSNTLYAKSGEQIVGASTTANPKIVISTTTGGLTGVSETTNLAPPTVSTEALINLGSTTATLAGITDPNGNSVAIKFQWGTSSTLVSPTDATASTSSSTSTDAINLSSDLTGLTADTNYYYRTVIAYTPAGGSLTTLYGDILSFKTNLIGSTSQTLTWATTFPTYDLNATSSITQNSTISQSGGNAGQFSDGNIYATSGLFVDVTSSTLSVCTVATSSTFDTANPPNETSAVYTITFLTTGTCTLVAIQPGNATYAASNSITKNITVTALYTVTFAGNSNTAGSPSVGSITQSTSGGSVTLATVNTLARTGYTFGGWNTQADGQGTNSTGGSIYTPASSLTLYAKWIPDTYTVTFDGNGSTGGSAPSSQTKTYAVDLTISTNSGTLVKSGYTFAGWNTAANGSGSNYAEGTTYSTNAGLALFAKWTANTYTVTFDGNSNTGGTAPANQSKTHDISLTLASNSGLLARTGYTFAGWNTQADGLGTPYAAGGSYTTNAGITLYAKWTINTYTVTYNGNSNTGGSAPANQTKTYAVDLTLAANTGTLVRTGYTFGGWNTLADGSGTPIAESATYSTNAGITLFAKWTANTYTLTYDGNSPTTGNPPGTTTYTTGSTSITIADNTGTPILAKTGYTFHGWYSDTTGTGGTSYPVGGTLTITQDTTIYAHWVAIGAKTVTFNKNDTSGTSGSQSASTSTALASSSALRTRTGYTFAGWNTQADGLGVTNYSEGGTYSFAADLALFAKWTPNTYTVTYEANSATSGSAPANQTKTHAVSLTLDANTGTLDRTGYTFGGWNTLANGSGDSYASGGSYTANAGITLFAKWNINTYTVTYDGNTSDGGTAPSDGSSPYNYGSTITVLGNTGSLTKSGFTFDNWSTLANGSGTDYAPTATFTLGAGNVTLYAQWTANAPTTYTITYGTTNSDGGTAPANTTGNGSVNLRSNSGNLTRSGYTFGGWNTGTGCSGTNYAANASYILGANITLYPCWNVISPPPSDPEPTPDPEPTRARNIPVAKIKPAVVWKNPNAIKTTTTLSTVQLNAVATLASSVTTMISNPAMPNQLPSNAPTIAGTYVYTPILPTVVTAGVNQVTTITSASNAMTGITKTVPTTTTSSTPSNSSSPTNTEEKPVLGQGTTLAPGLQKMKVVFIPTDSTTYEPVETEVEILVQAETKVEWVEPAPIKKNTPVGLAQFNATGSAPGISNNVPGTYKYDIPEGKTFEPGKYPVKVVFTPTDPNYLPSETTTMITVIADINPLPTPIVTPSNVAAAKPITNTTSVAKTTILSIGSGLSSAATSGTQVSVLPIATFSGKTTVKVSVTDEGETKVVDVPVTVLPLPAVAPVATPNTKGQSTINWKPSVNAVQYEVTLAGKTICTTSATSCSTNALIGPKSEIVVTAKGNDETVAPVTPAKYIAPAKPVTALVVYFDTNKFNLDAKDKADIRAVAKVIIEQGFKNIVVNGHTDIRGGVDNQVLSRNRSNSTFDYLKSLVPGLNVTIGAFASTKPAVKGTSAAALASNRRAEVGVF